jgi:hypothetical protein
LWNEETADSFFLKEMEKGKYWLSMPLEEPPSVMHAF